MSKLNALYINKDRVVYAVLNNSSAGYSLGLVFDTGVSVNINSNVYGNFWEIAKILGLSEESFSGDKDEQETQS